MGSNKRNFWSKLKAILFGIFFGLLLCEVILRIYNPFPFAIKKGKLILPANQSKVYKNKWINKLDKEIHYSRNSLGFRGPELPTDTSGIISMITIGGSTTECKFLSDSCTWSSQLYTLLHNDNNKIWLNNAGMDGHSTFGHTLLLKEYVIRLKPRFALFMTGVNDVELDKADEFDLMTEKKINTRSLKLFLKSLLNHTELGRTIFSFYQVQVAYKKGLIHREIKLDELVENPLTDSAITMVLKKQDHYLASYKQRMDSLIKRCLQNGIRPVLITQPSLFGNYIDSITGIAVGNKWFNRDGNGENCILAEKKLELYNDVLRSYSSVATVIDLSKLMPKKSIYYYDFIHFTNLGAEKVAAILYLELKRILSNPTL
jgi:hypothetical protein